MPQTVFRPTVMLSAIAVTAFLAACSNSSTGPSLLGDWHGFVALHDEFGVPLTNDSGVVITVANNGHTGPSTVSSATGSYVLSGLHTGTYTLSYSAAGIGAFLRPQIGFVGGGTQFLGLQNLSQSSTGVVTGISVLTAPGSDTLKISGTIAAPPAGLRRPVRVFYSSANTVSAGPGSYTLSAVYSTATPAFTLIVTGTDLAAVRAAFGSGNPAYIVAYGDSFYSNTYVDTTTGSAVYPNVSKSPSNTLAFVVP